MATKPVDLTPRLHEAIAEAVRYLDDRAGALMYGPQSPVTQTILERTQRVRAELLEAYEEAGRA